MLPDIRAVIAAFVAAVGLLMIAFGVTATFRVAQESRGALQADLAKRGQSVPPKSGGRTVTVIDTPGPHLAPPPPLPVVVVKDAPIRAAVSDMPLVFEAPPVMPRDAPPIVARDEAPLPLAEAVAPALAVPVGGPLAESGPAPSEADRAAARAERIKKLAAAKKAREARIARQRKAASRRAAQARAKQQATQSANSFGSTPFGGSFDRQ